MKHPITLAVLRGVTPSAGPVLPVASIPRLQGPALLRTPLAPLTPAQVQALAPSFVDRLTTGLDANIVDHPSGSYLSAGAHQFRSFWTRDFCWSVPGLLALGRADVVRDHLKLLLTSARPADGLLPRAIDSTNPKWRVVSAVVSYAFGVDRPQAAPPGQAQA